MEADSLKEFYTEAEILINLDFFREKIRILYLDDEIDELESFQSLYRRVFNVFIAYTRKSTRDY